MKRFISCVLILIFVAFSCYAESDPPQILFRNIPWGTNIDDALDTLAEDSGVGIKDWRRITGRAPDYITQNDLNTSQFTLGDYTNFDCRCFAYSVYNIYEIKVAGYTVKSTNDAFGLSFVYTPDSNGEIDINNTKNTALYFAYYNITDIIDPLKTYEDLIGKISSLYGKPTSVSTEGEVSRTSDKLHIAEWEGADDAVLLLVVKEHKGSSSGNMYYSARIQYNWMKGYEMIKEAENILQIKDQKDKEEEERIKRELEEKNYGSDDTEGL